MAFQPRHRVLLLPLLAALAHAGCSSEDVSGPDRDPVAVDSVPPIISFLLGPIEPAALGGEIEIRFTVRDAVGIKQTILSVQGAFEGADTLEYIDRPKDVSIVYTVPVPDDANADVPALFTLVVSDDAGHTKQGQTSVRLADLTPPLARIDLGGLHSDETIRTGESLDVFVIAEDNHRLTYIGYEGGGLRDSVSATSVGDSHAFRLTVPLSWLVERPVLTAWARDAAGRLSTPIGISRKEVPVYNWVDRSITNIPVPLDEVPLDVLWDARRNVVYRLRLEHDGTDNGRIDGVDVLSGAALAPIALPPYAHNFTFSPSGDSLVVVFPYVRSLGTVDLRASQRSVTMMPLQYDGYDIRGPWLGQASGGRFFVALVSGQYGSRLLDVNFGTGNHAVRTDIDGGSEVATSTSMLPLPDGRLVIGPESENPFEIRVIYSPQSNSFALTRRLRAVSRRQYTASPSGRFMMGNTVFGASLDSLATVSTQDWYADYGPPAAALSSDGLSVFLSTRYGYQKVRLSDGFILEQVKLGVTPLYLFAMPDGSRLIAVAQSVVKVVDIR